MSTDEEITSRGHEPPESPEDILGRVVRSELAPVLHELAQLRADLGLANGATRGVLHRVTDLEDRVSRLELVGADTERPSFVDSAEPGGES